MTSYICPLSSQLLYRHLEIESDARTLKFLWGVVWGIRKGWGLLVYTESSLSKQSSHQTRIVLAVLCSDVHHELNIPSLHFFSSKRSLAMISVFFSRILVFRYLSPQTTHQAELSHLTTDTFTKAAHARPTLQTSVISLILRFLLCGSLQTYLLFFLWRVWKARNNLTVQWNERLTD